MRTDLAGRRRRRISQKQAPKPARGEPNIAVLGRVFNCWLAADTQRADRKAAPRSKERSARFAGPVTVTQRLAAIESSAFGDAAERDLIITPQTGPPGLPPQVAAQFPRQPPHVSVVRGEWRHYA